MTLFFMFCYIVLMIDLADGYSENDDLGDKWLMSNKNTS